MFKRLTASILCLGLISAGTAQAAASSCFTPDEAKAAHFRTMLQEFNVAALNCRSTDPSFPSVSERYNSFVGKYGDKLQQNALAIRSHFKRAGGNLDQWMTRVANDAGQRVMTDPDFCQRASDVLDVAMEKQAAELDDFAVVTKVSATYIQDCPPPGVTKAKGKGKAKAKKKPQPQTTAARG